jgi:2-amino-4-hydroxy-6-hydroxymethyldihydropteridine diphosphokinase
VTARRPATRVRVAVALGSNLGDRAAHLAWACDGLGHILTGLRASPFENTAPLDVPDAQPDYLNAVVIGTTGLPPRAVLDTLLRLEAERGRTRPGIRSARTLDLDLILYGDLVVDESGLQVPHPRFRERDFVLGPLARLAPRWRDPVTGETLAALWRRRRLPGRG